MKYQYYKNRTTFECNVDVFFVLFFTLLSLLLELKNCSDASNSSHCYTSDEIPGVKLDVN